MNPIAHYIKFVDDIYSTSKATEHSYRGALAQLIIDLVANKDIKITNEPKRIACGAPDYVLTKFDLPIGYIEAKDINDKDLRGEKAKGGNKEQFDRYKGALHNIVFTDYLEFHFYDYKQARSVIRIGEVKDGHIVACPTSFSQFAELITDFVRDKFEPITSPERLAELMAGKALLMAQIITNAISEDDIDGQQSDIQTQYQAFRDILVKEMSPLEFGDMYAQTIAYGMFAARYQDTKDLKDAPKKFTRERAASLIPASNPFLRKLFQSIDIEELDTRLVWIVDELANIFDLAIVADMLTNEGNSNEKEDPIIHFYETFLAQYNPALRKARGVWYTPRPVVDFIIRAVDEILQTEFKLPDGLADTSKVLVKQYKDNVEIEPKEYHKVQLLDPATGTGTFLVEVVKFLHKTMANQVGAWPEYVQNELIPRLNGFELLMTSYAMAHLQLDILFAQTGFINKLKQRYNVYLTNSLDTPLSKEYGGFAAFLSREANEANAIKTKAPVMVVLGNPPYSGESANKNAWIENLMQEYKKEPDTTGKLQERNAKWLNDDYVKFIRMAQYYIEKLGEGIIAFINPHGFLDNPTFRGMRWSLLKAFDKIYVIDLHGNSKKKETALDGSKDENVFNIMQGVSINIFIKTGKKKPDQLGQVFHYDLYGKQKDKYNFLLKNSIKSVSFVELKPETPMYYMMQRNVTNLAQYEHGFAINELFGVSGVGITTAHDEFVINQSKENLLTIFKSFQKSPADEDFLHQKFNVAKKTGWKILDGHNNIKNKPDISTYIQPIAYRPFDTRYIFFEDKLVWRTVRKVMQNFLSNSNVPNLGLTVGRQSTDNYWSNLQIVNTIIDNRFHFSAKGTASLFPLYLYPQANSLLGDEPRSPNLKPEIIATIAECLGLKFVHEKEEDNNTFAPIDVLDYIYAVLHSPAYRERYKEFLKSDFPRVPYPQDVDLFRALVELGGQLRGLHLLETVSTRQQGGYPIAGNNTIEKITYQNNKVYINSTQYFDNVSEIAWNFYIGGYQPAQKWLKDRKEQVLSFEDIQHYQRIIVALSKTAELMTQIDTLLVF